MSTRVTRDPVRDLIRSIGGLLFASGALVLEIRKGSSWGAGGRMLAVLIPALVLYVLALGVLDRREPGAAERVVPDRRESGAAEPVGAAPWQSVLIVYAVILDAVWLAQFFHWVGAHGPLVTAAVTALTAASAAYAAWRVHVRYAGLLAALSLLIAWIALWDKILNHPSGTTNRWLLLIVGLIFVAAAVGLERRGRRESSEVVTVAGIAGIIAASLGVFLGLFALAASRISATGAAPSALGGFNARQHFIWDLILLVISLALIWWGSRARARGPGYVGAVGLLIFLFSTGYEVATRLSGGTPSGSVVGWPLALLLIGAIALVLGFWGDRIAALRGPGVPPPD
jgi:hypothetical protein